MKLNIKKIINEVGKKRGITEAFIIIWYNFHFHFHFTPLDKTMPYKKMINEIIHRWQTFCLTNNYVWNKISSIFTGIIIVEYKTTKIAARLAFLITNSFTTAQGDLIFQTDDFNYTVGKKSIYRQRYCYQI